MNFLNKFIFVLSTSFFINQIGLAQTTGSFNKDIVVDGQTRQVEYAVPDDYNENESYGLIVALRGCGNGTGPAATYRDQLEFMNSDFKTIVVAPIGLSLYYHKMDDSDSTIISKSIQDAIDTYNVNPQRVFLTGFSCNGYVTAKYGTYSTLYPFAGIIPYNAGITNAEIEAGDFKLDTDIPTCICIGSLDPNLDANMVLADSISSNGGSVLVNEMPNVGHTNSNPTFKDEMTECMNWLNNQLPPLSTTEHQNSNSLVKWNTTHGKTLSFQLEESAKGGQLFIYSIHGQLLFSQTITEINNSIHLNHLSDGMVFISLQLENNKKASQLFTIQ